MFDISFHSDGASKDIRRGVEFMQCNGTQLTISVPVSLLALKTALNLANYNSGAITPNGRSAALTKNYGSRKSNFNQ
jgi:hypothetical protein